MYMKTFFSLRRRRHEAYEPMFHQINLRLTLLCTICLDFQGEVVEFSSRNLGPRSCFVSEGVTEAAPQQSQTRRGSSGRGCL